MRRLAALRAEMRSRHFWTCRRRRGGPPGPVGLAARPRAWGRTWRFVVVLATLSAVIGTPAAAAEQGSAPRPNILMVVTDDMGWGQPGFNGGTEVGTPNLDRIANEGVRLTQFYASPGCSPTRASLLTGRHYWKTGGVQELPTRHSTVGMLLDERSVADALRDAGYETWAIGKWHLGKWHLGHLPLQRGFDHHYGMYSGTIGYNLHHHTGMLDWHRNGRPVVERGYATFLMAEEAVQLIGRHDGEDPFFLYLAFNAPHLPKQAPAEYIERYPDSSDPDQRAQLKALDDALGWVLGALESKGTLDDTLVVYLNDNGGTQRAGANAPYRGLKGDFHEGGIRVPAAMRWPGRIPAASESDALLHVVDVFPTLAGLAGASTTDGQPLDGLDAWQAIAEGAESPRQELAHSLKVMRVGDWKLLETDGVSYGGRANSRLQLYNIAEDPYEQTNLASSERAKVEQLRARLEEHRGDARDPAPRSTVPEGAFVLGFDENAAYGAAVERAVEAIAEGNTGPVLERLEVTGDRVRLVYDEPVDADFVPPTSAFRVVTTPSHAAVEVADVEANGSDVVLTLASRLGPGTAVGVTYDVPDSGAIRDADGLEAVGTTWRTATAASVDSVWQSTVTVEARDQYRGYSSIANPDQGAVADNSFDYGEGATYQVQVVVAYPDGVVFQVRNRGDAISGLVLEWAGETLPLADAAWDASWDRYTWSQAWLDANAPSLNASAYVATLPDGGTTPVCLRFAEQTCPASAAGGSDTASDDATLSSLTLSGIDIGTFAAATASYAATVGHDVSSTQVAATANDANADTTIADADGSTAGTSRTVALAEGSNTITVAVTAEDGTTTRTYTVTVTRAAAPTPLTASFRSAPASHDGSAEFRVRLSFSEALPQGSKSQMWRALSVTGGRVKTFLRVGSRLDLWELTVAPSGTDAVTLSVASTGSCGDEAAICTSDGRALSNVPSVTVPGTLPVSANANGPEGQTPNQSYLPGEVLTQISPQLGDRRHNQPTVVNGYLLLAGNGVHEFWDISDPYAPTRLSELFSPHRRGQGESHQVSYARFADGSLYLATTSGRGIDLWDIDDVRAPRLLSGFELPNTSYGDIHNAVWGIAWQGEYIYVGATSDGIHVIDAADPTQPRLVTTVPTSEMGGVLAGPLFALGNLLVVTTPKVHAGVVTMDIGDPAYPRLLDFHVPSGENSYIGSFYGRYAYLQFPLRIFDVTTDPRDIRQVGSANNRRTEYLSFDDGYAFVGGTRGGSQGIWKYDLSDPAKPRLESRIPGRDRRWDDQFSMPIGNLIAISDDQNVNGYVGSYLAVHADQPDTRPPVVEYVNPPDGALDQPTTTRIGLSFSGQIELASVDASTLVVRPAGGEPLKGMWGHTQTVVTFWPETPLLPDTDYEIVAPAGGIADLVGNALAEEFLSGFRTGAATTGDVGGIEPLAAVETGRSAHFTATPLLRPGAFRWDFGDGHGASGASVAHTYASPGRYTVTLSVDRPEGQDIFEAEDAALYGGAVVGDDWIKYLGTGYARFRGGSGSNATIDWLIERDAPAEVDLAVRYNNHSLGDLPLRLVVNGETAGTVAFARTGSPKRWRIEVIDGVSLEAGANSVKLVAPDGVGPIVDRLTVPTETMRPVALHSAVQIVNRPATASRPTRSGPVAVTTDGARAWAVNPDADTVTAVDTATQAKAFERGVGRTPRTLAQAPDGTIWVVNEASHDISVLDSSNGAVIDTINLPPASMPYGIAFAPDGSAAYVTLQATGQLQRIDPATRALVHSLALGPDADGTVPRPRGLAIDADGRRVLVSRFVSTDRGGAVYDVEVLGETAYRVRTIALAIDPGPDTPESGRGLPNYVGAPAISPDGTQAWVPSKKDNIERGGARDGQALTHESTVRTVLLRLDLAAGREDLDARLDLDDHDMASAVAFSPSGDLLFAAVQGSNTVLVVDAASGAQVAGMATGLAPQGLALDDLGRLYVQNFMGRSLSIFDVGGLLDGTGNSVELLAEVDLVAHETLSDEVLRGKRIFYDASSDRMSLEGYISCASCHLDGGQDGRTWDFTDRGEGLRNTISLLGRGGTGQGPLHWTGNFDEIQDVEHDIRSHFGGSGLMSDADFVSGTRSDPLGDPKAGLSADLDALAAYVASLHEVPPSPYRDAAGGLTAEGRRGRVVFADAGCGNCHGGDQFTDSALGVQHDIGTIGADSGGRLGRPLTGLDTPTLKGVWATAPYLHNGSAPTLAAAIEAHSGVSLSGSELDALVGYVRQIDEGADSLCASAPRSCADATLASLTLSDGNGNSVPLAPAFLAATTSYTAAVGRNVSSTQVTATATDANANVTIADADGSTAGASRTVALAEGPNAITVTVTADDGTTAAAYTVTVTREVAAPATPLTASFGSAPASHDGSTAFTVRLSFSEALLQGSERQIRRALSVTRGAAKTILKVEDRLDLWEVEVNPSGTDAVMMSLASTGSCGDRAAICSANGHALSNTPSATVPGPSEAELTASFESVPAEHDGTSEFTVRLRFSEDVTAGFKVLRDQAVSASGGAVRGAFRVNGRNDLWEVKVEPSGTNAVTISVASTGSCGGGSAICTSDGRALSNAPSVSVAGPKPLTASFSEVPAEHDGTHEFTVRLTFTEDIATGHLALRNEALSASGGTVSKARRLNGWSDIWKVHVKPSGSDDVTLTLDPPTDDCGEAGSVCTSKGRALSNVPSVTVPGPPDAALTASFQSVPAEHDGARGFTVRLRFSEALPQGSKSQFRRALSVTGGAVKTILRVRSRLDLWEVKVGPSGSNDVTMSLASTGSCGDEAAICTSDGRALSNTPSVTVSGPSAASATAVGPIVTLKWGSPRDGFGSPSASDYGVRANGKARAVASAELAGTTAWLTLESPVAPGDSVTVAYLGSAMHPLAEATGQVRSGPWDGLAAQNLTGIEPSRVPVLPVDYRPVDPLAAATADAVRLDASGLGLAEVWGVARLTALERLDLSGNAVSDLSPLAGLANLRDLDLSGNQATDLWPLSGLHVLERLDLSGNAVTDVQALAGLANLKVLLLDGNAVADLGPLTHLAALENLGLAGNWVGDLAALQDLPRLRRLDLSGNPAADLSPLGDVGPLVWLALPGRRVAASAGTLGRLTELRWVWLGSAEAPRADVPGLR